MTISYYIVVNWEKAGFCMLKPWNASKQAYEQTYEYTVYIKKEYCRMGLGRMAFCFLEEKAKNRNIVVIIAGMSYDNENSYKMCEALGFERCGHFKKVGKKIGEFLDLYYYQKIYL